MTVRDAIKETRFEHGDVEYRTFSPTHDEIWIGTALYDGSNLIPYDRDSYSLDDKIDRFEVKHPEGINDYLIVWYESHWIKA